MKAINFKNIILFHWFHALKRSRNSDQPSISMYLYYHDWILNSWLNLISFPTQRNQTFLKKWLSDWRQFFNLYWNSELGNDLQRLHKTWGEEHMGNFIMDQSGWQHSNSQCSILMSQERWPDTMNLMVEYYRNKQ